MKIAVIRRIIFASVFFIAAFPIMATGNEIDGFRLGMTMEQAVKVAAERGYSLGKAGHSSDPNWTSYFLSNGGPAISFADSIRRAHAAYIMDGLMKHAGMKKEDAAKWVAAKLVARVARFCTLTVAMSGSVPNRNDTVSE